MKFNPIVKLTPEVEAGSFILYLIRIDEEVVGYTGSEDRAKAIVDSFAAHEAEKMSDEWTKVVREDIEGGKKVILSSQALGRLYNSNILPSMKIDLIAIPSLTISKGRHSINIPIDLPIPDTSEVTPEVTPEGTPIPPPRPTPDVIKRIMKKRAKATATPQDDSDGSSEDSSEDSSDPDDSDSDEYDYNDEYIYEEEY